MIQLNNKMTVTENNATIIDVRTPDEYAIEHYQHAINIPLDVLPFRLNELKEIPKPIITYCRSGRRSEIAVSILKQAGVAEAINDGGIEDFKQRMKKRK